MQCPTCKMMNDPDAEFCQECGRALNNAVSTRSRRSYLFMFVLVPVLALIAGVGYYKFFLPSGIAAVVNSEEISTSELDAVVARAQGNNGAASGRVRHQFLNQLILERIVLQEARKAGISASPEDVASAVSRAQTSSGRSNNNFHALVMQRFGSMSSFEEAERCELIMKRIIARRVVSQGGDQQQADDAVNAWLEKLSARASVRIAFSEQWAGAECGCGDPKTQQAAGQGCAMSHKPE